MMNAFLLFALYIQYVTLVFHECVHSTKNDREMFHLILPSSVTLQLTFGVHRACVDCLKNRMML